VLVVVVVDVAEELPPSSPQADSRKARISGAASFAW
jgi:hypothetical protein